MFLGNQRKKLVSDIITPLSMNSGSSKAAFSNISGEGSVGGVSFPGLKLNCVRLIFNSPKRMAFQFGPL